jgi:hypothetical protein
MVAAALGLWGIFGSAIVSWVRKPNLELVFDRVSDFSEIIGQNWCLRVPVSNRTGRRSATAIEVFLESIRQEHVKNPLQSPKCLPVRLLWTHDRKPVCDRIAGGAYRLLDLGYLVFAAETKPDGVAFDLEIDQKPVLAVGSYVVGFLVTSDSSMKRYRFNMTIYDRHFEPKAKLERYLDIERS